VQRSRLELKLVAAVLTLFLVPTIAAGAVLFFLYRRGTLEDPVALAVAVGIGFVTMAVYLAVMTHQLGRSLVTTLHEIQLGTELMATVNPDHRLHITTGDELQSLGDEINRMADRVADARGGLEHEVARATQELAVERSKLSAVLDALGEGVVVATTDGRVMLANRAAQELLVPGGPAILGQRVFDLLDREKIEHYLEQVRAGAAPGRFSLQVRGGAVLGAAMTLFGEEHGAPIGFILVLRDVTVPARSAEARQLLIAESLTAFRGPLASVRSLSESLLGDPSLVDERARPLLAAIHAEALRLGTLMRHLGAPGGRGLHRAPWHFEEITVADLVRMTLRRLTPEFRDAPVDVELSEVAGIPPLKAEPSALTAALAALLGALPTPAAEQRAVRIAAMARGQVMQLELSREGTAAPSGLDDVLDIRLLLGGSETSPRAVVRRHSGEVWPFATAARVGFKVNLPLVDSEEVVSTGVHAFVGAGFRTGAGAGAAAERPDFYDFSLLAEATEHVRPEDRERRLDDAVFVVFDSETTGLDPARGDRIVSIAAVRVRGGTVRRGEVFDALVHPGRPIPPSSTRFHGITDTMVAEAPPIDVVLPAFVRFADGAVLVGHQVWFDLEFLARDCRRLARPSLTATHAVLDTLVLSEVVHGRLPGHALDVTAQRLGVTVHARHSALGDALTTAETLVRLLELLRKRGVVTLGAALDLMRRPRRSAVT
jgi:DNA polymerase-3 subunit epsilon